MQNKTKDYTAQMVWSRTMVALGSTWVLVLALMGCHVASDDPNQTKVVLPIWTQDQDPLKAVVENPLGTYVTMKYNHTTQYIDTLVDGQSIPLLPTISNGAFIPVSEQVLVPIWIFSKRLHVGQVLEVQCLGLVEYTEVGASKQEVIAVPVDTNLRSISASHFSDLLVDLEPVKYFFEYWLRNRRGVGKVSKITWKDEKAARTYVMSRKK